MAVFNIINLHEIENRFRIEAEFYNPEYVECNKSIKSIPHSRLSRCSQKITDGTHFTPKYTNSGVKFYSAVNVKEGYFADDESYKFINHYEHQCIHKRCPVQPGDVLIRKVGVGPRWSCVVPDNLDEFSIFVSVALVRPKSGLFPEYLSAFINSRYGQLQLLRLNKGISQPDLHLEDIGELLVPELSHEEQNKIVELVRASQEKRKNSRHLYLQAQQLLESELGLDKLSFQKLVGHAARFSTVSLSDTFNAGRIDAQCFAPNAIFYKSWLLKHAQCDSLIHLLKRAAKGRQQAEIANGSIDYCSIKHISSHELMETSKCQPTADTPLAGQNDLLLAITGATIGKIGIVRRYNHLAFSGDLLCLQTKPEIDPYYLLVVLDHSLGQAQFVRWITGSTNGHLSPREVGHVLVPRLKKDAEDRIAELVEESLRKRLESERLINQAKTHVEQLIEEVVQQ